jgi:hypothetical protein
MRRRDFLRGLGLALLGGAALPVAKPAEAPRDHRAKRIAATAQANIAWIEQHPAPKQERVFVRTSVAAPYEADDFVFTQLIPKARV